MLEYRHSRRSEIEMEYGDEATRRLHQEGISYRKGFDRQALMRLNRIKAAADQRDLSALKGNRFEKLNGDRAGCYSIRINDQSRITFRIENNRALDVTIEDYH
jgi:toxin HigB-1